MKHRFPLSRTVSNTQLSRSKVNFATWLLMLVATLPTALQAQLNYTTNDGTVTITGYTGTAGELTIPDFIDGLPVTSIGDGAFAEDGSLTSVAIPNTVTNIGYAAFSACGNLTNVTLGNGVVTIGEHAFDSCGSLTSIVIPSTAISIEYSAFSHCGSLTNITVDAFNSVYSSSDGVLFNKSQTTLLVCPGGRTGSYIVSSSVTNIHSLAFYHCGRLTAIIVDALNPAYSSVDGVLFDKSGTLLIQCPAGKAGSYAMPGGVASIRDQAFSYCISLTSVVMPRGVATIGTLAFYRCYSLTNVTLPSSVEFIGDFAFSFCLDLKSVYFCGDAPAGGAYAFFAANQVIVYYLPSTTGWGSTFGGRPTTLWNPQLKVSDSTFGVGTNCFRFEIVGTANIPIVLEACTSLTGADWQQLQTCTITNGSLYFCDTNWTEYSGRFYRIRSP